MGYDWLLRILKALLRGKYTGGIQVFFKDGGISSITRPKEDDKWTEIDKNNK